MRLTRNLSRHEFDSPDGYDLAIDFELVTILQRGCDDFTRIAGEPVGIKINSGIRSPSHNSKVGGASKSQHLIGKASDVVYFIKRTGRRIKPKTVYKYFTRKYPDKYGIQERRTFVHVDVRSTKWHSPRSH